MDSKSFGSGRASAKPIAEPMPATFKPSRRIIREISDAFAPKASRMPISCVRCPTEYAISP